MTRRLPIATTAAAAALCALALLAASTGAMPIGPRSIASALARAVGVVLPWSHTEQQSAVLFAVRLPRIVLGILVGATLATCGGALQGALRNPLADPSLLGISSGAALGAVATIVLAKAPPLWLLPTAAFVGALVASEILVRLARVDGRLVPATLLLIGVALTAAAGAITGLLAYVATDAQLRAINFWMLGSLGAATWKAVAVGAIPMLLATYLIPRHARTLDLLALGESEARHLGAPVERTKRIITLLVALGVGSAVSLTGIIGFIGLVVPHAVRLTLGPRHSTLLVMSGLGGAILLLAADLVARTAVAPAEVPIGVVTSAIGAPFFLWLVVRDRTVLRAS